MKRRPLYTPDYVRSMGEKFRNDLREMHYKHLRTYAGLRREIDELRELFGELRALHDKAVAAMRLSQQRERALTDAWRAERDIDAPLQ